jgi:hypothetical protein
VSDDGKPSALTEEMVRKLLQMNPHLRGEGQSTRDVLAGTQKTVAAAPAAPAAAPKERDLDAMLARMSREQSTWTIEHKKQQEALSKRNVELDAIARSAQADACALVIAALLESDPAISKPENKALLVAEKTFLANIAFSVDKLLAAKRKQGR